MRYTNINYTPTLQIDFDIFYFIYLTSENLNTIYGSFNN